MMSGFYDLLVAILLNILVVAAFVFGVWALTNAMIWSAKKILGMLGGPARRNLEAIRTKRDLAGINFNALVATEKIMKKLAEDGSSYRGR